METIKNNFPTKWNLIMKRWLFRNLDVSEKLCRNKTKMVFNRFRDLGERRERREVEMNCSLIANPEASEIEWRKNVCNI